VKTEAEIREAMHRLKVVGEKIDLVGGEHNYLSASISGAIHFAQWALSEGPDVAEVIDTTLKASIDSCQRKLSK